MADDLEPLTIEGVTASEILARELRTGPITDEELKVEGTVFYTTRYGDSRGNEMYLAYRDALARTEQEAVLLALDYMLETVSLGLHRIKTDPIICRYVRVTAAAELSIGFGISLRVTLIAGPDLDNYKNNMPPELVEMHQRRREENRATHTNVELIGEGELAHCLDCKGGEIELWDQTCLVRQSMAKVGME